jgi:hypothetical protein
MLPALYAWNKSRTTRALLKDGHLLRGGSIASRQGRKARKGMVKESSEVGLFSAIPFHSWISDW